MLEDTKYLILRYADDIVLIARNMNELQQLLDKVREASEKAGLFLNAKNTKTKTIQRQRAMNDDEHVTINGVAVENVKEFTYKAVAAIGAGRARAPTNNFQKLHFFILHMYRKKLIEPTMKLLFKMCFLAPSPPSVLSRSPR